MNYQILDLRVRKFLEKLGAGSHKPGSGSGAAFQGMIAASFVRTVALLTLEKPKYASRHTEFASYIEEIDDQLFPELGELCQIDSEQFGRVIEARILRDGAKSQSAEEFVNLAARALGELKSATEIPIKIAQLSMRVAELAIRVFDHGFQHARGDSSVALNSAISSIAGCVSIIDLNLTSFAHDEWTQDIRGRTDQIRKELIRLNQLEFERQQNLKREADTKQPYHLLLEEFRTGTWIDKTLSDKEIELLARKVLTEIWTHRHKIWNDLIPRTPLDVMHPELALQLLGYEYKVVDTLGQYELDGQTIEVAGIINHDEPNVEISLQFPLEIRNFTTAHELGHSLLHKQSGLHRDRAINGSEENFPRDWQERQADVFASNFLMPRKTVSIMFNELFLSREFIVNQDTAFALGFDTIAILHDEIDRLRGDSKFPNRGLSRLLATHQTFNGKNFTPLSSQLKVSIEALAIRLEQLHLVKKF